MASLFKHYITKKQKKTIKDLVKWISPKSKELTTDDVFEAFKAYYREKPAFKVRVRDFLYTLDKDPLDF